MYCCALNAVAVGQHSTNCESAAPAGTCFNHRVIAHDAEGEQRWCDFCGRDAQGRQVHKAAR